ncbi:regulation of nuclear pre-mRNA domain-containing protein 2-like isoform X2 [Eriocheir sinensis]|uniref:regulation of nuclear pre-mRNA domain-containing protein 2-like isoform X2 n=1 Tax=Eriocheir sinensis TaxID=95602 RepID=UPI0021CA6F86|nr:regulation of nuclear pre-mRNA domain-containing protein 2-like isoform X2 [Eriocheir sinensis]
MSKTKESKMDSRSLEKRLSAVRETAEDIQALSRWCVQHKNHHHSIIQAWSRTVRKSKVPHRLTLFYVCNDIVQNSRRKKIPDLVQHFATAIKEAAPLVREEKIRPKIIRIFNIWEERGVYDAKFVSELTEIVENVGTVNASENEVVLSSFQPVQLVEGIRGVLALNKSTESMLTDLKNQEFSLGDEEINQLRQTVKERGTSRERMEEFEEALIALECYLAAVQKEVEERTQLVTLLEQAEIFYETQRGEAKLVANAYKNFGNRVKSLHSKLLEKAKTLPEGSPIPSPSVDAPSPENSDEEDLSLPDSGSSGLDSFLNSSKLADFAKDALGGGSSDLESRLAAFRKNEVSPKKTPPKMKESRELYRSSSRDRSGAEWEYSHLVREREYSHTSSTTYDVPTPVPPPKELKPMSAAELLDTFGRAYQSSSKSVVGTAISSGATASEYKAPKTPTTPNSSIPDLSRPPPGLSGAITPGNPPVTDTPAYSPLPTTTQAHYSQTYPLPETSPKAPYVAAEPTYTPYDPSSTWAPPPPPPPPPPELQGGGTERVGPEYDVGRSYSPTWSEFESYSSAPGDVNDDEADNRNWGEPPGNEELQALASDTPSSPPIFEKGFTGALVPPPLPPPFCARSNLRELVSEGEDGDHRKNLVNIQPKGEDSDYRCYDYSFLSDQVSKSKTVKVPSIHSLFSSGDDLDLRVKKSGIKQSKDDSGSDMDISASGSEEDKDDMDISDESGKDALNKKGERKAEKKNHSKENKSQGNSSNCAKQDNGTKKKVSSNLPISVNKNAKPSSDNKVIEDKPGSTQSKSSDLKTDGSAADVKVSKIESVKPEKRKSVDHDNDNSAKIQKSLDKSGSNSNNDVDDKGDVSDEGRDWYKDFSKTGEDKQIAEEPIPTVVPKTGGRGHSNSRAMEETNVIDVIKSLDREFHQQRAKGNFNSHSNRGGSFFSDGGSPQHGNGGYFKGPKPLRGRPGGPGFYPPHRGRGRPQPLLPFGPPGRGFYGGHEPFARGRGGGRRGLRGRGRW